MMTIYSLFSGSRGNCTYLRAGDTRILIDAGMSCRAIARALASIGDSIQNISAVFITHEHVDHVKALPVFLKQRPIPVHITEKSADVLRQSGFPTDLFVLHPPVFTVETGAFTVQSFPTPHDSRMSVGYRITAADARGVETAALATDIGTITPEIREHLSGAVSVILEANHDENMLMMGDYPYDLKRRILSNRGHLSNTACGAFLCELADCGTRHVLLAHLSQENNTPELAYLTAKTSLERHGCTIDRDITLAVARQDQPVRLL